MATETPKLPAWAESLRQRMRDRLAGFGRFAVRLLPRVALAGAVLLCLALVPMLTGRVAGLVLLGAAVLVLAAWASGQIPRRYRLAWFAGFVALIAAWATQPHFGANLCPLTGFMWETDFVEQVRPTIHRKIIRRSVQQAGWPTDGVTVAQFAAVADQAVDLLKQCVAERGVDRCRYAGSDPNGAMMQGYTIDGPNAIAPPDRDKYRYIKAGLDYEISMIPESAGGSAVTIQTSRFGKPLATGGEICDLGCWCNADYGR